MSEKEGKVKKKNQRVSECVQERERESKPRWSQYVNIFCITPCGLMYKFNKHIRGLQITSYSSLGISKRAEILLLEKLGAF